MFKFFLSIIIVISFNLNLISQADTKKGNVIFIHPDGTGLADWNALRMIKAGPDSEIY